MNGFFYAKLTTQVSQRPNLVNHLVEPIGRILLLWQNLWHKAAELSGNPQQMLTFEGQTCSLGRAFTINLLILNVVLLYLWVLYSSSTPSHTRNPCPSD